MNNFVTIQQYNKSMACYYNTWFGHVRRIDDDNVEKSVLATEIEGSHSRSRPKLRQMDRFKQGREEHNIHPRYTQNGLPIEG